MHLPYACNAVNKRFALQHEETDLYITIEHNDCDRLQTETVLYLANTACFP